MPALNIPITKREIQFSIFQPSTKNLVAVYVLVLLTVLCIADSTYSGTRFLCGKQKIPCLAKFVYHASVVVCEFEMSQCEPGAQLWSPEPTSGPSLDSWCGGRTELNRTDETESNRSAGSLSAL